MKTVVFFCMFCLLPLLLIAQKNNTLPHSKLAEFLPTVELDGFDRQTPVGTSVAEDNLAWTEASVSYIQSRDSENFDEDISEDITEDAPMSQIINLTLADYGSDGSISGIFDAFAQEVNTTNSHSYEKSVTVLGKYRGIESVSRGSDYNVCSLSFGIANRFLITIEGMETSDLSLLYKLLDSMDLAKLQKAS